MKKHTLILAFMLLVMQAAAQDIYERPQQQEPEHAFDVLHYRIELTFEGANRAFEGRTTVQLKSLEDGLKNIGLHAETYTVRSVKTANGQDLEFFHTNGILDITLNEAIDYDETISLVIEYGTERFEVDPTAYGMGANYPLGIGYFEAEGDRPFLFNAYSFPEGARHWFPCYDHPSDRATHETIITTQGDHKVLANGLLESTVRNADGTVTYHWNQHQPHSTYLYNFVSGPYAVIQDNYKGLPVNYWVYPADTSKALRSFHRTPEVLAFFEDYYGVDYPWDKYDQICVPGIGGGAEATTATLIGASTLHDERAEQDFPSHWLVAHEAAHHWWGDLVSYRDWTQTWLSESFATFSEYLYSNHLNGPEEGALNLYNKRSAYLNEAKNRYQRPIVFDRWNYPNENFDSHTYPKGALVLHMLRDHLGEAKFRKVLNHFLTKHAYQPVHTNDFRKALWEVTGLHLDWFFEQWIYGAGHPVLDISYEWEDEKVRLMIKQTQKTSEHIGIFRLPLDIRITTENDTIAHQIWMEGADEYWVLDCPEKPKLVQVDPDNVLLKEWTFEKTAEELLYQAGNTGTISRLWATQELSKHTQQKKVQDYLIRQAQQDRFWAVRQAALQSWEKGGNAEIDIYQKALNDPHSQVRTTAIELLGKTERPELAGLYLEQFKKDSSYRVQAAAVRALGRLKRSADWTFFQQVSEMESPRNLLRNAGQWALEQR